MKIPHLVIRGAKLALICAVAAVVLGLVNAVTAPVIVENKARALAEGLAAIAAQSGIAGASVDEAVAMGDSPGVTTLYPISGSDGTVVGYVADLLGTGYGGDMQILAGYFASGELFSATLMENTETPGLGKKAESPAYMEKFIGYGAEEGIPASKDELPAEEADAITGATITFLGVGNALVNGSDAVREQSNTGGTQ